MANSNDNTKSIHNIEKLKNDGKNYRIWSIRCRMVLIDRGLWSIVNPKATTSNRPSPISTSAAPQTPAASQTTSAAQTPTAPRTSTASSPDPTQVWEEKDERALAQICLTLEENPLNIAEDKKSAKEAWVALEKRFVGQGALDASDLAYDLHHIKLDDSKPLEPQINQMRILCQQLDSLGDTITDAKFALIIAKALPHAYKPLKTIAIANTQDASTLACETLLGQIIREEKSIKSEEAETATLLVRSTKLPEKGNKLAGKKPQKGKDRPRCTNLKCNKIGHTFEQCWAEGGGSEGQRPPKSKDGQSKKPLRDNKKEAKVDVLLAGEHAAVARHGPAQISEWVVDSGASSHICAHREWFSFFTPLNPPRPIYLGDKRILNAIGQGQIHVIIHNNFGERHAILKEVLYCPQIGTNLLSVTHLTKCGSNIHFANNKCQIYNPNNDLIGMAFSSNGLYRLICTIFGAEQAYITRYDGNNVEAAQLARTTTATASIDVWHARLGHISVDSILKMVRSGMARGIDVGGNEPTDYCEECEASGHTRSPIPKETLTRSKEVLGRVFSDVCEVQTITREGFRYFITFVDDHSRFLTVYPIKKKSDALEIFKEYLAEAERQSGNKLKILRTDGGGEYFSSDFIKYLKDAGIVHEKTNPHTPQENGVAERVNRTLVTMTIAMLESVKSLVGHTAWPYALRHATRIKNVIPHSSLPDGVSPYELWTGNKPSVSTIRTFGCKATLAVPENQWDKLASRSITGVHLGLAVGKKAFIIYDPNTRRIHESRDVHFFEGSTESERVTIEVPEVESGSHVVQRDEEVEGQKAEGQRAEGGATSIVEGGNKEPKEMNGRVEDGLSDDAQEEIVPEMPRRSGRVRRARVRDDDHRYFVSSYNRGNQPDKHTTPNKRAKYMPM
jgi:hypothetical protein